MFTLRRQEGAQHMSSHPAWMQNPPSHHSHAWLSAAAPPGTVRLHRGPCHARSTGSSRDVGAHGGKVCWRQQFLEVVFPLAWRVDEVTYYVCIFSRADPWDRLVRFVLALCLPQLGGQAVGCILTPDIRQRGFGCLGCQYGFYWF